MNFLFVAVSILNWLPFMVLPHVLKLQRLAYYCYTETGMKEQGAILYLETFDCLHRNITFAMLRGIEPQNPF